MNQESASVAENHHLIIKKTLQFIIPVSIFALSLYSYCTGFISYSLQFSTLIFSLLAQALDRKYMFLICNGILAFVINSFKFENRGGTLMMNSHDEDGEEAGLVVNVAVQKYEDSRDDDGEEEDDDDDDDDGEFVNTTEERERSINRSVSTEELNKKVEEFIRKMKKEISVESQQPLVTVEE